MKEKDFKQIVTSYDDTYKNRVIIDEFIQKFQKEVEENLDNKVKIQEIIKADWLEFNIYADITNIKLYLYVESTINNFSYIMNALENSLIVLNVNQETRLTNSFTFNYLDKQIELVVINKEELNDIKDFEQELNDCFKKYGILSNVFKVIHYVVINDAIKDIQPLILFSIFKHSLNESIENKYYKYLEAFIQSLDDALNNKKYEIDYLKKQLLLTDLLGEAKLNELKKLRKSLAKVAKDEDETINKFDSSKEVIIDVNPIKNSDNSYSWHFEIIDRGMFNTGAVSNDLNSTILKGVFKGLKQVVDTQYLMNKNIYLVCNQNIFSDEILTSDEAKSRMKTIKQLIENNNLKVKQK